MTRCEPRTAVSALRMASCVAPSDDERIARGVVLLVGDAEQQVLGRDVLVFEVGGFLKCLLQRLC